MQESYEAILRGDRLEWSGESRPDPARRNRPVAVRVTVIDDSASTGDGRLMSEALERLAASHALPDLVDPSSWQREARRERPATEG
ncbi:MAG: hypothetical protein M3534_17090 [Actinomycetota bacterium]|jgi:hypothetical protein|nr:hypothetical protein [Actinomycetota bacterium]